MIPVVLIYTMRRVDCPRRGAKIEHVMRKMSRAIDKVRMEEAYKNALYHNLGDLPEPEFTHPFF